MQKPLNAKNSRLKLAFVLDDGLDSGDGVQQYILTLGRWLTSQGHSVFYLVGETTRDDLSNVHSLAKNMKVSFNGNKLTIPLPASSKQIKQLLAKEKFDVLHVQMPYSPFFAAKVVANAPANTGIVGTFHILPFGVVSSLGTHLLGISLRKNLKKFDQFISVSPAAQIFAKKTFKISSQIIPNTVNLDIYEPSKDYKRDNAVTRIVFVGRLVERKGCEYLIRALGEVKSSNPKIEFELIVCGKGKLLPKLKSLAKNLGLGTDVKFLGFVSEKDKSLYLQSADIAVFPAYGGESFGIVLIEAMAAKAGSVIAGNNPGYATVMNDIPEALVDVRDEDIFAKKLYELIINVSLRNKIYKKQQSTIKNYDVNTVGQQILGVYKIAKSQSLTDNVKGRNR